MPEDLPPALWNALLNADGPTVSNAIERFQVRPGDLLHADCNGVVSIPLEILSDLPAAIDEVLRSEQETLRRLRESGYDLEARRKRLEH